MIDNLPEDLILHIWNFIETDKDSRSFKQSSPILSKIGNENGYIRNLSNKNLDIIDFLKIYYQNHKTIKNIYLENLNNPLEWFRESLPKIIHFNNCDLTDINPPKSNTEILIFENFKKENIKIKWESFKNLKILILNCHDVSNLHEIYKCKELEKVFLNLENCKNIPIEVCKLQNLQYFYTNCSIRENCNFESKFLKVLLLEKKGNVTCDSLKLNQNHLKHNYDYNINCFNFLEN